MTIRVIDGCSNPIPLQGIGNLEGVLGAGAGPVDAVLGLEPGDGARATAIAIWVLAGLCNGEGLADFRAALDEEGGITIIDIRDGERLREGSLLETIAIGVIQSCSDLCAID